MSKKARFWSFWVATPCVLGFLTGDWWFNDSFVIETIAEWLRMRYVIIA